MKLGFTHSHAPNKLFMKYFPVIPINKLPQSSHVLHCVLLDKQFMEFM